MHPCPNGGGRGCSRACSIPRPGLRCNRCDLEWSIENIDDNVFRKGTETVELGDFVGRTLGEVQQEFGARNDAIYFPQQESLLRADRFIDLSHKYQNPKEEWEKGKGTDR